MQQDRELEYLAEYMQKVAGQPELDVAQMADAKVRIWETVTHSGRPNLIKRLLPFVSVMIAATLVVTIFLSGSLLRPGNVIPSNTTTTTTSTPDAEITSALDTLDKQASGLDQDLTTLDNWQSSVSDLGAQY